MTLLTVPTHRSTSVEPELVSRFHYTYFRRSHAREDPANTFKRDSAGPCVTFGDLRDPVGRYKDLECNEAYYRYQMCIPPVFDINNNVVEPSKYKDVIHDRTLIAVRGKLKM